MMTNAHTREPISPLVELWIGLEQPKLGDAISLLRHHFGLTRTGLIQRIWDLSREQDLGVDESLVYRWERGEKGKARSRPGPRYRMLLGRVCECEVETLSESSRREFLGKLAAIGGPSMLFGLTGTEFLIGSAHWAASPQALERAATVLSDGVGNGLTVAEVSQITGLYESLRNRIPGSQLIGAVRAQTEFIAQHLNESPLPGRARAAMVSALGEVSVLAGVLSFWAMRDEAAARHHFEAAGTAAREVGNHALGSYSLGFTAEMESDLQHPAKALELNKAAQEIAARNAPPRVRSWLAAGEARANARPGDNTVLPVLQRARDEMAKVRIGDEEPQWIKFFDQASLERYEGEALVKAGHASPALRSLKQASAQTNPALKKYHAYIAVDTAWGLVQTRELDESCVHLAKAFDLASSLKHRDGLQRVLNVRRQMEQWNDSPAVKELDARLRSGWMV
jgi:hypothetical protein